MNYIQIKIISFVFFIIFSWFMFVVFRSYIIENQLRGVDANIVNTKQYIKSAIEFLINENKQQYVKLSNIIFSDDKVIKALEIKNRKNFYNRIKSYYDRARKRDKNFWGLHIILPDNMSFIRVHKPQVIDKLIPKGKKPLIDQVNETHQQMISFDAGKFGYFLRVVTPILSTQKKYLGVAEFSVSVDSLTQYIKQNFGYEALFLVKNIHKKNFLNKLPKTHNGLTLFKSTSESFFKNYNLDSHKAKYPYQYYNIFTDNKEKYFSTVLIELSDTATLVVAFDVTNIIEEHVIFKNNITSLISLVILVFSIIWFFATLFYLKHKKQVTSLLQKNHEIISSNVVFSNTDLDGIVTEVSDAFCNISGYNREQLIGSSHGIIRHPDVEDSIYENMWQTIKADKIWKGEIKNLKQNGDSYWVDVTISPKFDNNHKKIGYMSIKHNITDRKTIEAISILDSLCGIYNRRHFDNLFQKIINTSKRNNEIVCFLIMDVDYFKQYNDTYGHQMGDDVLKRIAKSLKKSLHRGDDYCFRLGGEEFGVIFKAENKQLAKDFANTFKNIITNLISISFIILVKIIYIHN